MSGCAFDLGGVMCIALKSMSCEGCSFYVTKKNLDASRKRSAQRISTLPLKQRQHIYEKYYSDDNRQRWEGDDGIDKRRNH